MGNETYQKRQKELARQRKKQEKAARRQERKEEKMSRPRPDGEDPDIAGIRPGPQPENYW